MEPPDSAEVDLAARAYALLEALDQLGHPSSQKERRAILDRLGLEPSVSAFLARYRAIARPASEPSKSTVREITDLGRKWLANPELIQDAASPSSSWVNRVHDELREFARRHQLPVDRTGYILETKSSWRCNLWPQLARAPDLPSEEDLHRWAHHLRSSQAFALNLFVPLQLGFGWARDVWSEVLPDARRVTFEYPASGDPLNERRDGTSHRTRVDVRVDCGEDEAVLIEVKLTEPEFGGCSAARDEDNPHLATCTKAGLSLEQIRDGCYLVQARSRKYFELMLDPDSIVDASAVEALSAAGCALRGGAYQLVRNLLMAQYVRSSEGKRTRVLVVSPDARLNPALHAPSGLYGEPTVEQLLKKLVRAEFRDTVGVVDFRPIIERAAMIGGEAGDWASYMSEKYVRPLESAA